MPSPVPAVEHYAELLASGALPSDALCLTAVRGLSTAEALARFDAAGTTRPTTLADAGAATTNAFPDQLPLVVVSEHDGWVVLVENNGFRGAVPRTLARLSEGSVAASAYWNVDFDSALALARDGAVVGSYEFTIGGDPPPGPLAPLLDGLDFEDATVLCASALAFVERVSGVRLDADWAAAAHPTAVVDPAGPAAPAGWLAVNAPEVSAALPGADPAVLRDLASEVAARARAATGADPASEHERADDLAALSRAAYHRALELRWDRCTPPDEVDPIARLRAEQVRRRADTTEEHALVARSHAYAAARAALAPNPADAVAEAVVHACWADRPNWDSLRAALAARLT